MQKIDGILKLYLNVVNIGPNSDQRKNSNGEGVGIGKYGIKETRNLQVSLLYIGGPSSIAKRINDKN